MREDADHTGNIKDKDNGQRGSMASRRGDGLWAER